MWEYGKIHSVTRGTQNQKKKHKNTNTQRTPFILYRSNSNSNRVSVCTRSVGVLVRTRRVWCGNGLCEVNSYHMHHLENIHIEMRARSEYELSRANVMILSVLHRAAVPFCPISSFAFYFSHTFAHWVSIVASLSAPPCTSRAFCFATK